MAKKKRKTTKAWAVVDRDTEQIMDGFGLMIFKTRSDARAQAAFVSNPKDVCAKVSRVTITVED